MVFRDVHVSVGCSADVRVVEVNRRVAHGAADVDVILLHAAAHEGAVDAHGGVRRGARGDSGHARSPVVAVCDGARGAGAGGELGQVDGSDGDGHGLGGAARALWRHLTHHLSVIELVQVLHALACANVDTRRALGAITAEARAVHGQPCAAVHAKADRVYALNPGGTGRRCQCHNSRQHQDAPRRVSTTHRSHVTWPHVCARRWLAQHGALARFSSRLVWNFTARVSARGCGNY